MHAVMQYLPFTRKLSAEEVGEVVERMVQEELLLPHEVEVLRLEHIAAFLQSPLGERLMNSDQVYRELPFTLALPAEEAFPEWSETGGKMERRFWYRG